ncbi:MAG: dihydrofolate reductase, partial [Gammaproteobacteria bacterium]|nr:dihydrofolate reductase [Gammaproteobacteria bacterium]NIO25096.1 dihydrofolate reductase [Gammaproteobacteria bacterium]NIQ26956.1 dihydrofolate reductase [Gammaproteobacteria bacterium]NIT93647.1 dihydrofolate reductase [Gammaproteobacteria bacterium]
IVMGRRTWETLDKPLPDRRNVVLTRDPGYRARGADVVRSIDEAVELARQAGEGELFIAGGGEIYALALPRADCLDLTIVHAEPEGDAQFPEFDETEWVLVQDDRHEPDERHAHAYSFRRYERRRT